MKNLLLILIFLMFAQKITAQTGLETYCDFEGTKVIYFGYYSGELDTLANNPASNSVNSSRHCAKYIRDTAFYDNFQMHPTSKLMDISTFEVPGFSGPKIKMKIYSTAPVGTEIRLQLGSSSSTSYPAGIRSEFKATTTVKDAWQELKFYFDQMTPGGSVSASNIDKLVFLVNPASNNTYTIYFDNIEGPALATVGVAVIESMPSFKLFQNSPNPAKEITHINFQVNTPGAVTLKLYDMLGNPVFSLLDQNLKAGNYSIPVETENIPNGIYFYVLKKEGLSRSMKMIVSK